MNTRSTKKLSTLLNKKVNIGFVFWFLFGMLFIIIFYKPFEQPVLFDRAYLLYMSQVVFRGDPLYTATTFGYTPWSTILVGYFMKLGNILTLDTIQSARILGILLYSTLSGSIYVLCKGIFTDKKATLVACILFCGLGYLSALSGVNAEPKLWVLLFSVFGIHFFNKKKWFLVGIFFSFAAMSWHVAVISLFACGVMLFCNYRQFLPMLYRLLLGVFVGILPVLFYLYVTNGWLDFWNQAVLRKLLIEGKTLGESPFIWLLEGIYPCFILEILHFLFALFGIMIGVYVFVKKKIRDQDVFKDQQTLLFLIVYCILWSVFNSFEFQADNDLLPLIPPIIIFSTYFLLVVLKKVHPQKYVIAIFTVLLICYSFFDAIIYDIPYTFSEQRTTIDRLKKRYDKPFVIGFEEYYVLQEEPMPTKFMRFQSYEDHMIENSIGCQKVEEMLQQQFSSIIQFNDSKYVRSASLQELLNLLEKSNYYIRENNKGACASHILENYTSSKAIDSFSIKYQSIPLGKDYYNIKYYSVYDVE